MKNNDRPIGALWRKKSDGGMDYLKGNIDLGPLFQKVEIVVFQNDKKTNGQPDYRIFISQRQEKQETPF
ncbi:MAG: hypothetical protein L0Y56_21670 [Nitrospira sp.]|nr:hypothetical protein [Nitrospira sp.]